MAMAHKRSLLKAVRGAVLVTHAAAGMAASGAAFKEVERMIRVAEGMLRSAAAHLDALPAADGPGQVDLEAKEKEKPRRKRRGHRHKRDFVKQPVADSAMAVDAGAGAPPTNPSAGPPLPEASSSQAVACTTIAQVTQVLELEDSVVIGDLSELGLPQQLQGADEAHTNTEGAHAGIALGLAKGSRIAVRHGPHRGKEGIVRSLGTTGGTASIVGKKKETMFFSWEDV